MRRVLIVEDQVAIAEMESLLATMEGYAVEVAVSGEAAMERLAVASPDLVILDLNLGGAVTGEDILKSLRSGGHNPPVLVVSALIDSALDARLTSQYSNVVTMAKPFPVQELSRRIAGVLAGLPPPG